MIAPIRLYAGIIAIVALLSGVLWLGWTIAGWRADSQRLASVQAELAAVQAEADRQRIAADTAVRGYVDELSRLRRVARGPARTVRLCADADPVLPATAGSPDASDAGGGELQAPARPGRDVGPELYALADDADEIAAQCRALQTWIRDSRQP